MSREEEIRERLEAATAGPWFVASGVTIKAPFDVGQEHIARASWSSDAELIANAPTDLQALLAENARLRAQLDTVRKLADRATPLRGFGGEFPGVVSVTDLRATLNQGGETNGR